MKNEIADMRAVLYLRYSSDNQTEQSIEGQRRVCEEFAERSGYEIVGEYIDRAKSATTDNRPQFQQMIKDASKGEFKFIIVYKLDRFARNRYDSATYKHRLKQYGVRVVSATEHLSDSPECIMTEALLEANAEYYSAELSQKTKRGMRESALKGNSTGGVIPLGYKLVDKHLEIDESTKIIPETAFTMYADGKGKKAIANELNDKGYRTRAGNKFTVKSFDNMLSNKKYMGVYCYNGEVEVEGGCPAIIDRDLYDKVQSKINATKKAPAMAKAKANYLLSGKLFCGMCGAPMTGISGKSQNGDTYNYYTCRTHHNTKDCPKLNERKDFLEWFICDAITEVFRLDEHKDDIADKIIDAYKIAFGTSGVDDLDKRLKSIQYKISQTADLIIDTGNKAFLSKLENLQEQETEIQDSLAAARIAERHIPSHKDMLNFLDKISKLDPMSEKHREYLIDTFVNRVYLYDNKITIIFNTKNTSETISFDQIREHEKSIEDVCISEALGSQTCTYTNQVFILNTMLCISFERR